MSAIFDKVITKQRYDQLVECYFRKDCIHYDSNIRCELVKMKIEMDSNYETNNTHDKLLTKDRVLTILSFDEMFEMFLQIHLDNNHNECTLDEDMKSKYQFESICLDFVKIACNVCYKTEENLVNEPLIEVSQEAKTDEVISGDIQLDETYKEASVYVVLAPIVNQATSKFQYLLIYEDLQTKYTILRPLIERAEMEIAFELFKIMTQFGPPVKMYLYGYNKKLDNQIRDRLRDLAPNFEIGIESKSMEYGKASFVFNKIKEWLSVVTPIKSLNWELGLPYVQKIINRKSDGNDPFKSLFGNVSDGCDMDIASDLLVYSNSLNLSE